MRLDETLRSLHQAEEIWKGMSPLARYALIEKLPYVASMTARCNACIRYIADNLDDFTKEVEPAPERNIEDGGIHRIM